MARPLYGMSFDCEGGTKAPVAVDVEFSEEIEMTVHDQETVRLEAAIPRRLLDRIQAFVASGQYRDLDEVLLEALRRYADSHGDALSEQFVGEDVEWGLRGSD